jgi:DNA mismatch repair protein MutL
MSRIRLLPERVVNRIAAGEVIERPAAAVRELVENALDAGARRITVAIDGGGIERIEVVDDGCGMTPEELPLAVQRHATSKLPDDDLIRIVTLGFRGEALPSIGAAARLAITSRPPGAESAAAIAVDGGSVREVMPSAGTFGTRVLVSELFHATPARRNFLKSARAEADAAEAAIWRLAMAAPQVAFRFETDGRVAFDLPPQNLAGRVAALLGPEAAAALLPITGERGGVSLSGFAAAPPVSRATASAQALVVNGRPVTDPVLRTAVRVAYRDVLPAGRHAVVALFLELPAEDLDVNVHPGKAEVRFRAPDLVRGLVISSLGRTLAASAGAVTPIPRLSPPPRPPLRLAYPPPNVAASGFAEASPALAPLPSGRTLPERTPLSTSDALAPAADAAEYPLGAAIAQAFDTYVIAVTADGSLVLVDQHAAHERLTHEALREQFLSGGVRTQPLLLPAVVDLPPAKAAALLEHAAALARLGLEVEAFGAGSVLVRALPALLGAPDPTPVVRDLAEELADQGEAVALEARLDAAIARLACHGSVRAGRRLTQAEMDALLRQMERTPRSATCSHGRPTFLKLTRTQIEGLFGRR